MRKLYALGIFGMVIFVITVLSFRYSEAAMNPAPPFCTRQGYTLTEMENQTQHCVFSDGNKCEIWEFYRGECGSEYRKEFSCVSEGDPVFSFDKCCDGLEPYLKCRMFGQPTCRQTPSIFQKFWESLLCFFGL